jgi:peptide/nickel transport system substrate-binding protein
MAPSAARALVALLALASSGCAPAPTPPAAPSGTAPTYGGRLVYPLPIEPATLNFVTGSDVPSRVVARLVGDSLIDHDAGLKTVPRLAALWEFTEGGRVLTFHLRPGVRFHDGAPFTSSDVLYTYERVVDPKSKAMGWLDPFLPIERVETPDPLTVRVIYRFPYGPALLGWDVPILPRHLYEKENFATARFNRAPIGTGPFRFDSWEAGQRIVLVANQDYWGGRPYLDSLVIQVIPSQETTLQALLAGEIDFARLTPVQWQAHAGGAAFTRRFRTMRYVPLFLYYIAWRGDGSNPFFSDPAVRRAMSLALDREGYVRSTLRGLGEVASSPFHPAVGGADPGLPPVPYDPAGAAALLDEAGWPLDPRTGLRTRNGIPFRFTLLILGKGEDHVQFSQVAQESFRRLGIEMSIERLDWPSLWARLKSGAFQAALSGMAPGIDPDGVYPALHSSQIGGGMNYAAFRDRDVDAWLEEGRRTLDPGARTELYHKIDRRVREVQPYAYLFYPVMQVAVARRAQNVFASPYGILDYHPGPARFYIGDGDGR